MNHAYSQSLDDPRLTPRKKLEKMAQLEEDNKDLKSKNDRLVEEKNKLKEENMKLKSEVKRLRGREGEILNLVNVSEDPQVMKRQILSMAKKLLEMRKQVEDLNDENEVLRETAYSLRQKLLQPDPTIDDIHKQLAELELQLEETAAAQARYNKVYDKYRRFLAKYGDIDEADDTDSLLGP